MVVEAGLAFVTAEPQVEQQLKSLIITHYNRSLSDGNVSNRMKELKNSFEEITWLN